jgi:hypothetical protein
MLPYLPILKLLFDLDLGLAEEVEAFPYPPLAVPENTSSIHRKIQHTALSSSKEMSVNDSLLKDFQSQDLSIIWYVDRRKNFDPLYEHYTHTRNVTTAVSDAGFGRSK